MSSAESFSSGWTVIRSGREVDLFGGGDHAQHFDKQKYQKMIADFRLCVGLPFDAVAVKHFEREIRVY